MLRDTINPKISELDSTTLMQVRRHTGNLGSVCDKSIWFASWVVQQIDEEIERRRGHDEDTPLEPAIWRYPERLTVTELCYAALAAQILARFPKGCTHLVAEFYDRLATELMFSAALNVEAADPVEISRRRAKELPGLLNPATE